ncbi:hypothetical protein QJS04_geneDACA020950 [Acorus gramineus]|uniref:Uncharacterized protein n=1 Tax=Acorus gramineus TaxID=55184 RepID=A0AAV9B2N3_ACOGR|nr:hypothetical protein QJS04_geneDACA020950 [Acorus gramineus]
MSCKLSLSLQCRVYGKKDALASSKGLTHISCKFSNLFAPLSHNAFMEGH